MVKVSIKRAKNGRAPVVRAIFSLAVCQIAAMPIAAMPAVAAESGCSGFACLFSRQETNKPVEPAAANDVARGAASPAPIAQVPNSPASKDAQAAVQPQDGERAKRQTAPPRPVITIAADPLEVARLKALALVVPRERIRIVRPDEPADLVLTKVLGDAGHSGPRLFTEAVHVVAGPRIGQMKDLEGKAVAFTGTRDANVIARQAFEAAHIAVWATSLDLANALDGLSSGDLDAVVVIAPSPVAQLAGLGASGLHLLSWPTARLCRRAAPRRPSRPIATRTSSSRANLSAP